jgi:chromosome segregation protein
LDLVVEELAETEERLRTVQASLEELRKVAKQGKAEESKLAAELEKHQTYLAERVQKNQELRERLRGIESKITILSELERSYQGYYHGVKALLEASREPFHREVHGVVADLIRPERGCELALEVALGSALQNIVINHHRHAGQAITYLKQNKLGRATFLPLNLIEMKAERLADYKALLTQYNSRPATEVVFYDQKYQAVVSHLLSSTIIAPDLKTAVDIAEKTKKKFRVVTLEGEVIAPGGAITGGNLDRRQSGLLSRKGEIRQLTGEKQDLLAFLERGLTEERKTQTEIEALAKEYDKQRHSGQEIIFQQNSILKDMEAMNASHQKILKQKVLLETARQKLKGELSSQKSVVLQLQGKQQHIESELGLISQAIQSLEERESRLIQEREESLRELSILSAQFAGVQQEWVGKQENLQENERSIQELRSELTRRESELQKTKEDLKRLENEKNQLEANICRSGQELAAEEAALEQLRILWQSVMNSVNQMEIGRRDLQKQEGEFLTELHRLE